jgi:hypothetical protein
MPFQISAQVNGTLPGSVLVAVTGDPGVPSSIIRVDGAFPGQYVRNYSGTGTGLETVVDAEAPLGRLVYYRLLAYDGSVLAQSNTVQCAEPADGRSLLRSVLKPTVAWLWVEPQDEAGVQWRTSTTAFDIVGSDTPVVVGEVRQRHAGTLSFLAKSVGEANDIVSLLRDGLPMLLRHSPCAGRQTRDMLFYAGSITEVIRTSQGWRTVLVDYQTTKFVQGDTDEPPSSWDFAALAASATDFQALTNNYATFQDMALNRLKGASTGGGLF